MSCLSCFSATTTTTTITNLICSSLTNNNSSSKTSPPPTHLPTQKIGKPVLRRIKNAPLTPTSTKKQPSVADIERAIGAGVFRDRDPRGSGENQTLFDMLFASSIGRPEGTVEKKLREAGEWIIDTTEGPSRSSGLGILMVVCLRILPLWLLFLLIASGVLKLPFSIPFLDDLIINPRSLGVDCLSTTINGFAFINCGRSCTVRVRNRTGKGTTRDTIEQERP